MKRMKRFIDPCCERCLHTANSPCKDFVKCCVEGPLCHDDADCKQQRKAVVNKVALNERFVIC